MGHSSVRILRDIEVHEDERTFANALLDQLEFTTNECTVLRETFDERPFTEDVDIYRRPLRMEPEAIVEVRFLDQVCEYPLEPVFTLESVFILVREDEFHHHRLLVLEWLGRVPTEDGRVRGLVAHGDRAFNC